MIGHWLVALVFASVVLGCGTPDENCDAILGAPDSISVAQCREFGKWVRVGFGTPISGGASLVISQTEYELTSAAVITYYDSEGGLMGTFPMRIDKGIIATPKPRGMWESLMIQADSLYCYWIDAVMANKPERLYIPILER